MRYLENKAEMEELINGRKFPVLTLDLADTDEYGLKGCNVILRGDDGRDGNPSLTRARLRGFSDKTELTFHRLPEHIGGKLTYMEMQEMLNFANAPVLRGNSKFILAVIDSRSKNTMYRPMILHTGEYDGLVYDTMHVTDKEFSTLPLLYAAGVNIERWLPEEVIAE